MLLRYKQQYTFFVHTCACVTIIIMFPWRLFLLSLFNSIISFEWFVICVCIIFFCFIFLFQIFHFSPYNPKVICVRSILSPPFCHIFAHTYFIYITISLYFLCISFLSCKRSLFFLYLLFSLLFIQKKTWAKHILFLYKRQNIIVQSIFLGFFTIQTHFYSCKRSSSLHSSVLCSSFSPLFSLFLSHSPVLEYSFERTIKIHSSKKKEQQKENIERKLNTEKK